MGGTAPSEPARPVERAPDPGVVRLIVCDDHRILTETLALAVRGDPGMMLVVPPLETPEAAIEAAAEHQPDVVLMDITFEGGMDGIQATRRIKEVAPRSAVVIVTAHPEDRLLMEALEVGASGLLSKTEGLSTVLDAIRDAARGELLFDARQLAALVARTARDREAKRDHEARLERLTPREREVLTLLARGMRSDDMARTLFITPQTVQTHVRNILAKLQVRSRLEAALFFAEIAESRGEPPASAGGRAP